MKSLLATKDPKGRIAQWIVDIWSYDFTLLQRKGQDNLDSDALSRIERSKEDIENEKTQHIMAQGADSNTPADKLRKGQKEDIKIQEVLSQPVRKRPFV